MKYIFANWKCHKNTTEITTWAKWFQGVSLEKITVIICPSFVYLPLVHSLLPTAKLGAQTVSPFPNGAYTGAVSAQMVSELAQYVILGHSERRAHFAETDQIVANQTREALDNNLTPIVSVDLHNWSSQLAQFTDAQLQNIFVMYEPPEAISTAAGGHSVAIEDVKKALQLIASHYTVKGYLYGGSVTAENVAAYLEITDGAVVGAASVDPTDFSKLLKAATDH